ncbi:MAG: oligopeptide ABC transporter permease [Candidatus Margulisiibacteriota bacterium]
MHKFKKNKLAIIGLIVISGFFLLALFANLIAPYNPSAIIENSTQSPSLQHWFGTDEIGRDIFSRILFGARISLSVGFVAVVIAILVGTVVGAVAGYFGGWVDGGLMRFVDVMLAFPSIFLLLTIQVMLQPNIYNVMVVIGLTSWMGVARLVRGEFLVQKERPYVESARAIGAANSRIIFLHILPNAISPIIVAATLGMAGAILTESSLSFLGLGVQPPMPSWGNMLMDAQAYMRDAPWIAVFPGIFILLSVLSLYFVGEGLREEFNPKE